MSENCGGDAAAPKDVGQGQTNAPSSHSVSIGTGTDDLDFGNPVGNVNESWNLDSYLQSQVEDKNPFSGLSEEHLNQLEDVLSSAAVTSLLQQAEFQTLDSNIIHTMEEPGPSTQGFGFDEAAAHQIIQDGVREHELAVIAAAFNDHAYAIPMNREPASSPVNIMEPVLPTVDAPSPTENKTIKDIDADESPQPKRRSTRISDAEQREMAEKILQENRQMAREAMMEKDEPEEMEMEEPKKKRGRPPKADTEQSTNPLNTKWDKKNRRTRSSKVQDEAESGQEEGTTEEDTHKPVVVRKKAVSGTDTPPPMKRTSRGKWKNPLFRDRPDSTDSSSPIKTPQSKKKDTEKGKPTPKAGRGRKKKQEEVGEEENVDVEEEVKLKVNDEPEVDESKVKVDNTGNGDVKTPEEPIATEDCKIENIPYSEFISQLGTTATKGKTITKGKVGKAVAKKNKKASVVQSEPVVKKGLKKVGLVKGKKVKVKLKDASTTHSSEEDVPLGQLKQANQKKKKPKPKAKATLTKQSQSQTATSSDEDDVPLKDLTKLTKSPTKLKKLKAAISAKRGVKLLHKKPGKSKVLKLKPTSHMKKLIQKQKLLAKNRGSPGLKKQPAEVKVEEKPETEAPKTPSSYDKMAAKRKVRKSETESFLDPTMTDLFKPDGVIVHEHEKDIPLSPEIKFDAKGHRIPETDIKPNKQEADLVKCEKDGEVKVEKSPVKKSPLVKLEKSPHTKSGTSTEVKVEQVTEVKGEKTEVKNPEQVKGEKVNSVKSELTVVAKARKDSGKSENIKTKGGKDASKHFKRKHSSGDRTKCEKGSVEDKPAMKTDEERRDSKSSNPEKPDNGHESESGMSYQDDENDSDWFDPDTLYCLCNKPHNDRFMIQCDACEQWYHGSCVGVSKTMGQEFEAQNMDFVCPICTEAGVDPKPKETKVEKFYSPIKVSKSSSVSSSSEANVSSTTTGVEAPKNSSTTEKIKIEKKPCVGKHCKREARFGSVYCSNECIIQHAKLSLSVIQQDRDKLTTKKSEDPDTPLNKPGTAKVAVFDRKTGRIINGPTAPTESTLQDWLEKHPTFEVLQPSSKSHRSHSSSSSSSSKHHHRDHNRDKNRKDRDRKDKHHHSNREKDRSKSKHDRDGEKKTSEKKDDGPDPIRINVRKSLRDALANRADQADDVLLSSSEIKGISLAIEEEMFKYFKDIGHKYRAKYRSLVFNIKDTKNNGLFRKILTGKIRASKLVQMSSTELASKELAEWRKMENKHAIKMIEDTEKKAMKEGVHIRKKTHKGEIELDEDLSTLRDEAEKPVSIKPKLEPKADLLSALIVDTTDKHRLHLFDLNCKICTGKQAPPAEDSTPKKVTILHSVKGEKKEEEGDQSGDLKEEDLVMAEEVVKEALANVKKTKIDIPDSPKVTVRSPDSALQSGLESRAKFTPSGPVLWKGFIHMQEFSKFFTSAYRVSGPAASLGFADTIQICGRIVPEQVWDYLSKIKQTGTRDICVIRFIPAGDDEKTSYVNLYSYLNSRARCGVVGNSPKHIKDFYIIPLASHSRIPPLLIPFDGPGLEDNRPHMLIGIIVRQKSKSIKSSLKDPTRSKHQSSSTSQSSSSSAKKIRLSTDNPSSPYSTYKPRPDKKTSSTSVYVPISVGTGSGSSSETGTPTGYKDSHDPIVKAYSHEEVAALETEDSSANDTSEAYSPTKVAEEEEPYDPELEAVEVSKPAAPSSAMMRAMQLTLASLPNDESTIVDPRKAKVAFSLPSAGSTTAPTSTSCSSSSKEVKSSLKSPVSMSPNLESTPTQLESKPLDSKPSATAASSTPKISTPSSSASKTTVPSSSASSSSSSSSSHHHSHKSVLNVEKLVQQIANSTNPSEITALMVTALAASKDSTNQQKVLADLTRKVEEQKKLLVKKRAEIEKSRKLSPPTAAKPSEISKPKVEYVIKTKKIIAENKDRTGSTTTSIKEKHSKPEEAKTKFIPIPGVINIEIEPSAPSPPPKLESITVSSMKPHEMPLALQALMKDVMGHGTESRIKSKKIQKEKEPEKIEKVEPSEKDKDSLAIFKNVALRDKNVIPGLDDLPIAAILQREAAKESEIEINTIVLLSPDIEETSEDKDYRSEADNKNEERKDDSLDKDHRKPHSLDKDDRIVRGMLPRFIPTLPKPDWPIATTKSEQAASWPVSSDVDHRKFLESVPVSQAGSQPTPKEGNFRPIGVSVPEESSQDVDHRKPDGSLRSIGADPFGFGSQDVDMRRAPAGPLPPPPVPPLGANQGPHPPFIGPGPLFSIKRPPFRPPFPVSEVRPGCPRLRGPSPLDLKNVPSGASAPTKRGPPFQSFTEDGEPDGKKPRFPGSAPGFRPLKIPPLMMQNVRHPKVPAPPGTEPVVLMPPGMPPLPEEPLPPPPLPPPPSENKSDQDKSNTTKAPNVSKTSPATATKQDEDLRAATKKDEDLRTATKKDKDLRDRHGGKRQSCSSPRIEDRRNSKDRDDRVRFHSRHRSHERERDNRNSSRHRDKDYRSRDARR